MKCNESSSCGAHEYTVEEEEEEEEEEEDEERALTQLTSNVYKRISFPSVDTCCCLHPCLLTICLVFTLLTQLKDSSFFLADHVTSIMEQLIVD